MNFGNKKYLILILLLIFFAINLSLPKKKFEYNQKIIDLFKNKNYQFIAHAGGGINDITYTNSIEAVLKSIEKGFKLIEIDLRETTDKHFVGVHDWLSLKKHSNISSNITFDNSAISYEEFKKIKLFGKYTPITSKDINNIFSENKDLILVTDKSNNFKKIKNDFLFDNSRIIVEVFGKKNYFKSIEFGIENPMYSANHTDYDFIIKNNIKLIAASANDILAYKDIYRNLTKHGVIIFAYSSNNKNFIEKNLNRLFSAVYTDYWDIKNNDCFSSECKTY